MFKGLSVFFETYSITSLDNKNEALHPINVSCDIDTSIIKVKELLARNDFDDFIVDNNYKEIFAKNEKFEVTVSFIERTNGGTCIGMALFSPLYKRTKKILIELMQELSQTFTDERI